MSLWLQSLSSWVWGSFLICFLVGVGLYLSWRLRLVQVRGFFHALAVVSGRFDDPQHEGEISHFRALTTALSATIGTGNIVGVAAAILMGGPGAVFWMWVTAIVGMATKFTSCTLAVKFRRIDEKGQAHGGPMHYIEQGMGAHFRWLAILFATFTVLASFGIGNMFQVNNIVSAINGLCFGASHQVDLWLRILIGSAVAALVAVIIIGGIKRISVVTSKLVPFMCLFYVISGLLILARHWEMILPGIGLIFQQAFHAPESVAGGLFGGVIRSGVARGLFSNEAGLGSAPMAHGAARTNEPVREGLVAMLGPFIDTIIICSITALTIICTGAYEHFSDKSLLTVVAFESGLPGSGWLVMVGIVLFAFSTIIAWSYYGDRAADYLFGERSVVAYRWVYVGFVMAGALWPLDDVITFCDIMNGLMAFPNLIALLVLSPVVIDLTRSYWQRKQNIIQTRGN